MHVVPIRNLTRPRDAFQHAPGGHFLAMTYRTQTGRPQTYQSQPFKLARERNQAALAASQKRDERLHRRRTLPGDSLFLALLPLVQQCLDAALSGRVDGVQDALLGRAQKGLYSALDFLIFQRGIAQYRFHVARFESIQLACQPEIDARLRSMTAMKLATALPPSRQQRGDFPLVAGQQRGDSSGVGLRRIKPIFLDVFDDPRRLLTADAEQIGQFPTRDAVLLAQLSQPRAELVGQPG